MKKIYKNLINIIIIALISTIRFYQFFISPLLRSNCRYLPTCSEYSIESIRIHGPLKGLLLSVKRIFSCHPLGSQGYDPVPYKKGRK